MDVFKTNLPNNRLNKYFIELINNPGFTPAKSLISDIAQTFTDKDGNFVEQFQTTAFYPRLWELFLFELFRELGLQVISDKIRPDFHLLKSGYDFFLEASCSNPAQNDEYTDEFLEKAYTKKDKIVEKNIQDYYSIKIGSVLFSKLQMKYWELEWVKNKPLVIAISASHNKFATFFPDYKLIEYLYGQATKTIINAEGKQEIIQNVVEEHIHKNKKIPSAFLNNLMLKISALSYSLIHAIYINLIELGMKESIKRMK